MTTILLTVALLFVGLNVYTFFRRQTYRQTGFGDLLPIGPAIRLPPSYNRNLVADRVFCEIDVQKRRLTSSLLASSN